MTVHAIEVYNLIFTFPYSFHIFLRALCLTKHERKARRYTTDSQVLPYFWYWKNILQTNAQTDDV